MNDALIRRYLSGVRAEVLDIVDEKNDATRDEIVLVWSKRHPVTAGARAPRARRVVDQLVWQLENLEWIDRRGDRFVVTRLGRHARDLGRQTVR